MWKILLTAVLSIGALFGAQTVAPQTFGASQPISALTAKTTLAGSDTLVIVDNASTPTTKKISVTNASTSFKAFNDLTYSPLFSTSAGLASLLSDETGSGGGFVRASAPTLSSPVLTTPTVTLGSDATGDIYYRNGSGIFTRLAFSSGKALWASSTTGIPEWTNSQILLNPMTASSTFTATTTHASSVLFTGTQGGAYGGVSIGATAAATSSGNLIVSGNASSSYLIVSNTCTNCVSGYATSSSSTGGPSTNTGRGSVTATCPANTNILSGGGKVDTTVKYLVESYPSAYNAWTVTVESANNVGGDTITAYAVCTNAIKYP